FFEIWLPAGAERVHIGVTPPDRPEQAVSLAAGESGMWTGPDGRARWSLIYPRHSALGSHGTCALLALEPTFHHERGHALAPFGRWTIRLHNRSRTQVPFDAYVDRDDVALGVNTCARQSFLEDRHYGTLGTLDGWLDQVHNPTPIRRSRIFNCLSTGRRSISVGGTRATDSGSDGLARFARYSPQRPDPDPTRAQRP